MNAPKRVTFYLTDDEFGILDAIARRLDLSRSAVIRHLLLYQGLCGGDMPLTTKILNETTAKRDQMIAEIRAAAEANKPIKTQGFRTWVKESLGSDSKEAQEKGADLLVEKLLAASRQTAA